MVGQGRSAVGRLGAARIVCAVMLTWLLTSAVALPITGEAALAKRLFLRTAVVVGQGLIPPKGLISLTDQCPASFPHPVGPDFSYIKGASVPGSVALAASYPKGPHGWFAEFANLTNQAQRLIVGVVCLAADARFAYPRVSNYPSPGRFSSGFTDCPRGAPHAIDNYFGVELATNAGSIVLAENYPAPFGKVEGFETGVRNLAGRPVKYFVGAVCTSLHSATTYVRDSVAAGRSGGDAVRCPRHAPVAVSGTFFPLPPKPHVKSEEGNIALDFGFPMFRNEWSMGVASLTGHAVKDVVGAVCVGK